ncbi:MAG: hypothetical protein C3F19_01345 [Rhodocyclales bacterium]|jgi:hypothetical protein|nr:MAG: hypothetical protein C3F19_01345 [Rhodocyclales bacterium]
MTTMLAERPARAAPKSLIHDRVERFSRLFDAHPDAVVVRREALGGNVLCALEFCERRGYRPLAFWRDDMAVEVAMTPAQYDEYLSAMAELASKRDDWGYLQTIYWKDMERPEGWCWMHVPAYSA